MKDIRTLMEGFKRGLKEENNSSDNFPTGYTSEFSDEDFDGLVDAVSTYIEDNHIFTNVENTILADYEEDDELFSDYVHPDYEFTKSDLIKAIKKAQGEGGNNLPITDFNDIPYGA